MGSHNAKLLSTRFPFRSLCAMAACRFGAFSVLLLLLSLPARGQLSQIDDMTRTPVEGAGYDYIKLLSETVDPSNGSVNLHIDIPTAAGRGINLPFSIDYNSGSVNALQPSWINGQSVWQDSGGWMGQGGWRYAAPMLSSVYWQTHIGATITCTFSTGYVFQDPMGGSHPLHLAKMTQNTSSSPFCPNYGLNWTSGTDGQVNATFGVGTDTPSVAVTDPDGTIYSFLGVQGAVGSGELPSRITDRNGNEITDTSSGAGIFTFKDTLGRTIVSSNGFGPAGHTNTITTPEGTYSVTWTTSSASYTVSHTLLSGIAANCPAPPNVSSTRTVISSITLPNGKQYQFSYDPTYGTLQKITYPTGGTVTYGWKMSDTLQELAINVQTSGTGSCYWEYSVPVVSSRTVSFTGSSTDLVQTFGPTSGPYFVAGVSPYTTTWSSSLVNWTLRTVTVVTTDSILGSSQTKHTYTPLGTISNSLYTSLPGTFNKIAVETKTDQYDWGTPSTPLTTEVKGWGNYPSQIFCDFTSLNGSSTYSGSFYQFAYNFAYSYNKIGDKRDYDWGVETAVPTDCKNGGSLPTVTPTRETQTTYQGIAGPSLVAFGMTFGMPSKIVTSVGSSEVAETDIAYDGTATTSVPATQHDDSDYPTTFTTRGNATTVTNCQIVAGACSSSLSSNTTYTYYYTGQVKTKTDPCGYPGATCSDISGGGSHQTTYSYVDNFTTLSGGANVPYTPTAATNAYLTQVTNGLSQTQSFKYDFNNGQLTSSTDPNSQTNTYIYNDSMSRPTTVNYADGGQSTYSYNDSTYNATAHTPSVSTSQKITSSVNKTATTAMDGLGHVIYSAVTSDPDAGTGQVDEVDTKYYGIDKVFSVTNPYRTISDPTYGITAYVYDGMGRTCLTTPPGQTPPANCPVSAPVGDIFTSYSLNCSTTTDEAGKVRKSCKDGLGRLITVIEDATTGGLNYETDYAYDALNNLTGVTQKGGTTSSSWVLRSFTFDSLSHLTTASNPEAGAVNYTYDLNGNAVTRTDFRSVVTTYGYDVLNRPLSKTYTNDPTSTPTVTYIYDVPDTGWNWVNQTSPVYTGISQTNIIGRVSQVNSTGASLRFGYDQMGRTILKSSCTPRTCGTDHYDLHYQYNLDGSLKFYDRGLDAVRNAATPGAGYYYGGYTLTPKSTGSLGVNNVLSITADTTNSRQPAAVLASAVYDAMGHRTSAALNGGSYAQARTYSNRGWYTGESTTVGSYTWNSTAGYAVNGAVNAGTDTYEGTWSYGYDPINRLSTATATVGPYSSLGMSWGMDGFGNQTSQGHTGSPSVAVPPVRSATYGNNNRILTASGFGPIGYDAAGNITSDGSHTYTYDAENRIHSVDATTIYTYDPEGNRIAKTVSGVVQTEYLYDTGSRRISSIGTSYLLTEGSIYANEELLAEDANDSILGGKATLLRLTDQVGTLRGLGDNAGNWIEKCLSLPYGDGQLCTSSTSTLFFTGKERDPESAATGAPGTGNDDFGARYYASTMGRFVSPDVGVDQHPANPQSWNLYTYGRNSPLVMVDQNGNYVCGASMSAAQCDQFQQFLDRAKAAADKLKDTYGADSEKYKDAQRAIDAFGKENVDNGVTVNIADIGVPADTRADPGGQKTDLNPTGQVIKVRVNSDLFKEGISDSLTAAIAHEGSHVADAEDWANTGFSEEARPGVFATEFRAYGVTIGIMEAFGATRLSGYIGGKGFDQFWIKNATDVYNDQIGRPAMIKLLYPDWAAKAWQDNMKGGGN